MTLEIEELKRRENAAGKALEEARKLREEAENKERDQRLEPIKALVISAHDILCRWNHTDGCGWSYEIEKDGSHNWNGWAHARWLRHYEEVLWPSRHSSNPPIKIETIYKLLEYCKAIRELDPTGLSIIRHRLEP